MYASDYRLQGRQTLAGKWLLAAAVSFVATLLGASLTGGSSINININISEVVEEYALSGELMSIFAVMGTGLGTLAIAKFLLGGPVTLGLSNFYLKLHDRQEASFSDLFGEFYRFGIGFALHFLTGLYIALWSLLLVIPGIVASYRYAMAPYILAENPEMSASEAIKASSDMMYGYKAELFWLDLTFIGWELLSILTLGIGSLFLVPYITASRTAFYRHISCKSTAE